jgi:hypothetical protein
MLFPIREETQCSTQPLDFLSVDESTELSVFDRESIPCSQKKRSKSGDGPRMESQQIEIKSDPLPLPELSDFDRKINHLVELVQERGLKSVAEEFNIMLTKCGKCDRRTKIGRALFARLENEVPVAEPVKKRAPRVKAVVPESVSDLAKATQMVQKCVPVIKAHIEKNKKE